MSDQKQQQKNKKRMKYKYLGKSGVKVSELCLGAMMFSKRGTNDWTMPTATEQESHEMLNYFVANGGNFIDTANVYSESEEVIGGWLRSRPNPSDLRESLVIATKGHMIMPRNPGVNNRGSSRKHLLPALDASLKRLNTDYVDLYQVHLWDTETPLRETMMVLNDMVRAGKVRYIGISNFTGWQIQKALDMAKEMGIETIVSAQQQYSLLCRDIEYDSLMVCRDNGVAVLPWSPLLGGWLSGKYTKDMKAPPQDSRVGWAEEKGWPATNWSALATPHTWNVLDTVNSVAQELKASASQVSLRWLMQCPGVACIPIVGPRKLAHLQDNMGSLDIVLTAAQLKRLNEASQKPLPYPQSMIYGRSRL